MVLRGIFTPLENSRAYSTVVVRRIRIAETRVRLSLSPHYFLMGRVAEAGVPCLPAGRDSPQVHFIDS